MYETNGDIVCNDSLTYYKGPHIVFTKYNIERPKGGLSMANTHKIIKYW